MRVDTAVVGNMPKMNVSALNVNANMNIYTSKVNIKRDLSLPLDWWSPHHRQKTKYNQKAKTNFYLTHQNIAHCFSETQKNMLIRWSPKLATIFKIESAQQK